VFLVKVKEDKVIIKGFKDLSSNWWVNDAHYSLNASGELVWHAGETDKEKLRNAILSFIRRNKKSFKNRSASMFEQEPKQYNEIIPIGKFKGQTVQHVFDNEKKYLTWMIREYNFEGKENLKQEITEILNK
jgi:uncharacterized protein (DUF3820 family)